MRQKFLDYAGSVVLGLSDAVVSITGALAGLSWSFHDSKIIGFAGAVIGISAALSMGASEFLSEREEGVKSPITSGLFTGGAYLAAAALLVLPYFVIPDPISAFWVVAVIAVAIVAAYAWYVSRHKEGSFFSRFGIMIGVCLFVGVLSFLFASGFQLLTGIEI